MAGFTVTDKQQQNTTDTEDLEALYQSFEPWLVSHARLTNPSHAEDAVQAAFAALAERTRKPPPIENPRGYLVTATRNALTKSAKKPRWFPINRTSHHDTYRDPDLSSALSALSPQQQTCLALRYGQDYTIPMISELLDLSESTIKTHISRGLNQLETQLED